MERLCNKCKSKNIVKAGYKKLKDSKIQRYKCKDCKSFFTGEEKFHRLDEKSKELILKKYKENLYLYRIADLLNVKLRTVQYQLEELLKNDPESRDNIKKNRQVFRNKNRSVKEIIKIKAFYKEKKKKDLQNQKIIGFKW